MARSRSRAGRAAGLALAVGLAAGGCNSVRNSWPVPTSLTRDDPRSALLRVEQMIDGLDRSMNQQGTIGVKSPDVWGQDRLAKFRSEYELQMAQWLKAGFKGVINASISRSEAQAQRLQLAAGLGDTAVTTTTTDGKTTTTTNEDDRTKALLSLISAQNAATAATAAQAALPASKGPATITADPSAGGMLEPTVVLDEHSHYLNHLNQLRRINAGDDLTDRPGYGMYLVRIPVTLSPGPKSRKGKGAIITVSAKSLMDRDTMRYTLRNAVVNEAVASLTQAICNDPDPAAEADPNSASGVGPLALIAAADAPAFYGAENIAFLRDETKSQLARELADEPYHRAARIADWLRGEFEASYTMLEQEAAPPTTSRTPSGQSAAPPEESDPFEALGALLARRDYTKLAAMRPRAGGPGDPGVMLASGDGVPTSPDAGRRRTLAALGFVLRLQAAALNTRLKQDIVDQVPEYRDFDRREELRRTNFFDPEGSTRAFEIFRRYTEAKWPLRVYAIEPVIAQQNVADSVARRSSTGLDLIGGVPAVGPLRAAGIFSTDRALADEEAAIRLNPTMVGFGAGESTFGWIFYPRLQTTATGRSGLAAVSQMLRNNLGDGEREQSIEPGQRECTALIVMPNFIPKIEFVTVANWFRSGDLDGRTSVIEKASDLGARLVEAEESLDDLNSSGAFAFSRPEELQVAVERLNQLRSLMPTQRLVVRVPFSAEHNDSRVFCSRGGQLRPSLTAWHGKPPEQGEESTIFLEGKNFSVHDTHVIAGGKTAESVLVSRNVMQVTISKDARPTPNAQGDPLLELSVATPNGASNHLLIRMGARSDHGDEPTRTATATPASRAAVAETVPKAAPQLPAPQTAAVEPAPKLAAPALAPPSVDSDLHRVSVPRPPASHD
ncbi:MAG: hypothetical protein BGO49_27000 [Planctomycetales bacterium 71-10]|nr:MAG: hypothetical protein BGO49_27000 [Planctomycetales bacterium 71-10]